MGEVGTLSTHQVSKHFGGVYALNQVSVECHAQEIVGLIGPNGAGKTTLLNVIAAVYPPDSGNVTLGELRIDGKRPDEVAVLGIARTFQNIRLFKRLTVRDNVEVSLAAVRKHRRHDEGVDAMAILGALGLRESADRKAGTLPYGHQRRLEIARALALAPSFMLLDEPAAGANESEALELIDAVRQIRTSAGCGLLVIDHDLRFVMGACERIYVLSDGEVIAHGKPADIRNDPKVVEVYLGSSAGGDGTKESTRSFDRTDDDPARHREGSREGENSDG